MIALLRRLYLRYMDRYDPAWKATGYAFTTPSTYDYAQALKAAKRAKRRSETGRILPQPKGVKVKDNVTPLVRKTGTR